MSPQEVKQSVDVFKRKWSVCHTSHCCAFFFLILDIHYTQGYKREIYGTGLSPQSHTLTPHLENFMSDMYAFTCSGFE